jgi:polyhydroxybutyrate depolymerase
VLLPLAAACGDEDPTPSPAATGPGPVTVELGDRPFTLYIPDSYDPSQPAPLVIGLHGYSSHAREMESYFKITAQADERGFLYAMPDGTRDSGQDQFWNATDVCCDFDRSGVDDSAYLSELIDTVKASYSVDADRVFLIGHSNGGFMSHRMACDHADQITAIAALAGTVWADPSRCTPSRPVNILQIHGTADGTVGYRGSGNQPGAERTAATWRELNGCADVTDTTAPARDLDRAAAGAETIVIAYTDGCAGGSRVELWRMEGSGHVPQLTPAFTPAVIDFFYAAQA